MKLEPDQPMTANPVETQISAPTPTERDKFERLAKALIAVPKSEIKEEAAKAAKAKRG